MADCVLETGHNPLPTRGALNEVIRTSQWMRTPTAMHGPERSTNESDGYPDLQLPPQAQTSRHYFP
jgi:hypothetical protein